MNGVIIIEGHVQGLSNVRAFGESGIPVIVIDKHNCIARYSKYCIKFFYCPDFISEEFVPFLINLCINEKLNNWMLFPSNDHAVYSISNHKKDLEKYYSLITPDYEIIERIYDKSKLLKLAEKLNVSTPRTQYFKTFTDKVDKDLKYPFITKGRNGLSFFRAMGKKAILSNNEDELREHLKQIAEKFEVERSFTQELIPYDGSNKTISFTAFCDKGLIKTLWIGEKIREHPIRFGTATFARSIECPGLIAPSQTLLQELKYSGVCEIEYLFDPRDNKYKLIEINPRTWLWVGLAKACGINYALISYNYLNGNEIEYPKSYDIGVNWVNNLTDIPFSLIALFKRKIRFSEYFSSFRGKTVDAFFSWKDIKPAFMFFVFLIYIAIKRS